METTPQPSPLPRNDTAFFSLLASLFLSCGYLLGGIFCAGAQLIFAIVFFVLAGKDEYALKFAKANLAITIAFFILNVIMYIVYFVLILGITATNLAGALTNPNMALAGVFATPVLTIGIFCFVILVYAVEIGLLGFLTYKVYKKETCPWF